MLTREQNDLLTQTGPGTPGGDRLRRYWQPTGLVADLPPGGAPLPVRLLGEDLVLFRDGKGGFGLLGLYCAHRRASRARLHLAPGRLPFRQQLQQAPTRQWSLALSRDMGTVLRGPGAPPMPFSAFHPV